MFAPFDTDNQVYKNQKKHTQHNATPHRARFNIDAMLACTRKHDHHTASTNEKQTKPKKQLKMQAILWCRKNHHMHIKREKRNQALGQSDKTVTCDLQAASRLTRGTSP